MKKAVIMLLALFLTVNTVQAYSGGSGTEADPYQISTAEDLIQLGETTDDYDKHFIMTADIDLAGYTFDEAVIAWDPDYDSNFDGIVFSGSFDGDGHTIANLCFSSSKSGYYVGLFGSINGADIKGLSLEGVDLAVSSSYVGSLAGYVDNSTISDCYCSGTIASTRSDSIYIGGFFGILKNSVVKDLSNYCDLSSVSTSRASVVGGIVGSVNNCEISNCNNNCRLSSLSSSDSHGFWGGIAGLFNTGIISGCSNEILSNTSTEMGYYSGGIVGLLYEGEIKDSFNLTDVGSVGLSFSCYSGGITGKSEKGKIINCFNTGKIFGRNAGGLVAYTQANCEIIGSYNEGEVVAGLFAGGIVGNMVGGCISSSYNNGDVSCNSGSCNANSGGIVGYLDQGTVIKCYSAGLICSSADRVAYCGGIVGSQYNDGIIEDCYFTGSLNAESSLKSTYSKTIAGGIVGLQSSGFISRCYSIGTISVEGYHGVVKGGLVGSGGNVVNSCWDVIVSGLSSSAGGVGLTTAEMQQAESYIGWNTPSEEVWVLEQGNAYPHLLWENSIGESLPIVTFGDIVPGEGTESSPYLISSAYQMNSIGLFPEQWDKVYSLESDIDMSVYAVSRFNIIGKSNPAPFSGIFYGNGYVIRNLTYETNCTLDKLGLFGRIDGGEIYDLTLEGLCLETSGDSVGGFAGSMVSGVISGCNCSGTIIGFSSVGGVVGSLASGVITECNSSSSVEGFSSVGGFAGSMVSGVITECNSSGSVKGFASVSVNVYASVGGFVGNQSGGEILDCSCSGCVNLESLVEDISYHSVYSGGLVGYVSGGKIYRCYSDGSVLSSSYNDDIFTGGLVGYLVDGDIKDCYSLSSVLANSVHVQGAIYAGGLIGKDMGGSIIHCYSAGLVEASGIGICVPGGLVGYGSNNVFCSYWDITSSGQESSAGGFGLTTIQLMQATSYIGWNTSSDANWTIDEGNGYPHLSWEKDSGELIPVVLLTDIIPGNGIDSDPYRITTAEQLSIIGLFPEEWDKVYSLESDIDMSECYDRPYPIIGCSVSLPFTGVFDGKFHVVRNLTINAPQGVLYVGLFGYVDNGMISNLGVEDASVISIKGYTGILVGKQYQGTINNCYTTGSVSSLYFVGGIAGCGEECIMSGCYSASNVNSVEMHSSYSSIQTAGGLVGYLDSGRISNCYSCGPVRSQYVAGGFVGCKENGIIENCFSSGRVEIVGDGVNYGNAYLGGFIGSGSSYVLARECFWDRQSSGVDVAIGYDADLDGEVTGLDTMEMQTLALYVSSGWDFSDDDGDPVDWQMPQGWYPILGWEDDIQLTTIPDVSGMNLEQAENAIEDAGMELGEVYYCFNESEVGLVYQQFYEANVSWRIGVPVRVDVFISKGEKYSGGIGTQSEPYQISTSEDLIKLSTYTEDYDKFFIVTQNINLAGFVFDNSLIAQNTGLSSSSFNGTVFSGFFDGCGHIISNLTIDKNESFCGLFGAIGSAGVIENLGLVNVIITGTGRYTGGLCGSNDGYINNCYVSGTINVANSVGMMAGVNSGNISNCYSSGIVISNLGYYLSFVGGLVGEFCGGLLENSYSSCSVSGSNFLGGFIGAHYGNGTITSCFWDTQTSGLGIGYNDYYYPSTSQGITGLSTAEMQTLSTYSEAGWNFRSMSGWKMYSGNYPVLMWQAMPDFDANGKVDISDFANMAKGWLDPGSELEKLDLDGSGLVDIGDLELFAAGWLSERFDVGSSLEGHWKFDEMTDQTAIDSSVFNRDGTIFGEPTLESGKIINSYSFDGIDDYVKIENYTGITGNGSRTVSAFIKADSDLNNIENNLHTIVSWGYNTTNGKWLLGLDDNTGQISLSVMGARIKGGPDLEDGNWHHVAVVFPEGATNVNQILLYLDGQRINTNASDFDMELNTVPSHVTIGAANLSSTFDSFTPGAFFKGSIDEVRIYREALDESDINMLAGLIGHWSLDKMTASKTEDLTGNGFDGTVVGEPSVQAGQIGNSFVFDGTDDYILVEDCYGISGNNDRTVSAFIKAEPDLDNTENNLHTIVSWGYNGASYGKWMVALDNETGQLALALYGSRIKGGPDLEDGQWHHVAVSMIYGYIFLCVDGQVVTSTQTQANTVISQVSIGAADSATTPDNFSPTSLFNGAIDEVRIYSIGMEPAEIAELANMGN